MVVFSCIIWLIFRPFYDGVGGCPVGPDLQRNSHIAQVKEDVTSPDLARGSKWRLKVGVAWKQAPDIKLTIMDDHDGSGGGLPIEENGGNGGRVPEGEDLVVDRTPVQAVTASPRIGPIVRYGRPSKLAVIFTNQVLANGCKMIGIVFFKHGWEESMGKA